MARTRTRLVRVVTVGLLSAAAMVSWALPSSASASAGPQLPLGHAGRWITDATGRVVVMHGTNMVYKLAPYYPGAAGFGAGDAAYLQRIGFNAVRVGVIWQALEPQPGVFNAAYLGQIARTVHTLAAHGIASLLDFHQDQLSQEYAGEGWPSWALQDDGLTNTRTPFSLGYEDNPALQRAFENFWANKPGPGGIGLQDRYAAAWRYVARRFRSTRSVLGYEVINEPFPGSDYLTCVTATCTTSDRELTRFYATVDHAIRAVDAHTLVFYEPYVTFNFGYQDHVGALHDPNAVFAWHDYCLTTSPCASNATDFRNAAAHIDHTGESEFLTEFGATTNTAALSRIVTLADRNMVSWTEWAYCTCSDPTGAPDEGIVNDPHKPKSGSNLVLPTLDALVEPYPQVIAGTPRSWSYNRTSRTFRLRATTTHPTGRGRFPAGSVTEVATPAFDYPHGYHVAVAGASIRSAPGARILRVASCARATALTVTVQPGRGRSRQGPCRRS